MPGEPAGPPGAAPARGGGEPLAHELCIGGRPDVKESRTSARLLPLVRRAVGILGHGIRELLDAREQAANGLAYALADILPYDAGVAPAQVRQPSHNSAADRALAAVRRHVEVVPTIRLGRSAGQGPVGVKIGECRGGRASTTHCCNTAVEAHKVLDRVQQDGLRGRLREQRHACSHEEPRLARQRYREARGKVRRPQRACLLRVQAVGRHVLCAEEPPLQLRDVLGGQVCQEFECPLRLVHAAELALRTAEMVPEARHQRRGHRVAGPGGAGVA
mmetsp:Transcript_65425/g.182044  ORF Transcript_65425/g.182044 Transcript_65425/m.182044 type:complete len:275 (+) Transcript_65425:1355-2179(+)